MPPDAFTFATAFLASMGLTPAARRFALRFGFVDLPGPRKIHIVPVPLLGGAAIYGAAVLAVYAFLADPAARVEAIGILTGATLLTMVGTLDDRGYVHPLFKLFIAMPAAAVMLILSGIRIEFPAGLFLPSSSPLELPLSIGLTIFWVVGITAAFNILDHMDGLCAGGAVIASAFFLLFATLNDQVLIGTLSAAFLGASLGFREDKYRYRDFQGGGELGSGRVDTTRRYSASINYSLTRDRPISVGVAYWQRRSNERDSRRYDGLRIQTSASVGF